MVVRVGVLLRRRLTVTRISLLDMSDYEYWVLLMSITNMVMSITNMVMSITNEPY